MQKWKPVGAIWGFIYAYVACALILMFFDDRATTAELLQAAALFLLPPAALNYAFGHKPKLKASTMWRCLAVAGYWLAWGFAILLLAAGRHSGLSTVFIAGLLSAVLTLGFFLNLRLPGNAAYFIGGPTAAFLALGLTGKLLQLAANGAENGMLWFIIIPPVLLLLLWYMRRKRK